MQLTKGLRMGYSRVIRKNGSRGSLYLGKSLIKQIGQLPWLGLGSCRARKGFSRLVGVPSFSQILAG